MLARSTACEQKGELPFHFASFAWPSNDPSVLRRLENVFKNSPASFATSTLGLWRTRSPGTRHRRSEGVWSRIYFERSTVGIHYMLSSRHAA